EVGIAYADITTSEFATTQLSLQRFISELERLKPREIITANSTELSGISLNTLVTRFDDYWFELDIAKKTILEHFNAATLDGYGCTNLPLAVRAAGSIIRYIQETQKEVQGQLTKLSTYSTSSFMAMDVQTQNNMEIFRSNHSGTVDGSLLSIIDLTQTAMGSRLLKRWLGQPLFNIKELTARQDAISWFYNNILARKQTISLLNKMADIERLINRVKSSIATPRELVTLRYGLEVIPELVKVIEQGDSNSSINWLKEDLKPRQDVVDLISEAIEDQPAPNLGEGGVIKKGFSKELDSLCLASRNAKHYLVNLEIQEREKTGIKSLKVRFNKIFGYYIEISNANLSQVPENYIRKQTLVGGERYFIPELKEYEALILNAQERIAELETDLFKRICRQIATASERILAVANALANVDLFSSLAEVAMRYGYIRPELTESDQIVIKGGRHPIVERNLADGTFIANDTFLSNSDEQLIILTGPNMAGKSTYLRQVALLVLLAQIGSFIPAESAVIGLIDRIFTRIGAREDISAGQSTFMVEMVETANILNNATSQSLIILDEIGRGTSTYDGLSIARAVAEYIHNYPKLEAKTLFATHYHEMVELASVLPRVKNYSIAVAEEKGEVTFLYKIVPGGVDKSYGIHVAQLAGLPKAVVRRAQELLEELEKDSSRTRGLIKRRRQKKEIVTQIPLFGQKPLVLEELEKIDIDSLSPLEALTKLYELQKKAKEE
ncbi:MAG: DNA mismatch repair protein MutS, partial [Dehalococcoidales bacterium]|nr:DNA mismatch repair protein MutS [Dehalococcoidales bacterium]